MGGTDCPDCQVRPGEAHLVGCDVARCSVCGEQRIGGCDREHPAGDGGVWTGEWPGGAECRELGLMQANGWPDLNALAMEAAQGRLVWNGRRWVRPDGGESREDSR